jgi:hypothetical protein
MWNPNEEGGETNRALPPKVLGSDVPPVSTRQRFTPAGSHTLATVWCFA